MVKQLMLHSRLIMAYRDLMREFLNAKEEQCNHLLGLGDAGAYIQTIVTEGSIHVWATSPNKFLEECPSTLDLAEGREFVIHSWAWAESNRDSTPEITV
jgi:hypothetical protein